MTFLDYFDRGFCVLILRAEKNDVIFIGSEERDERARCIHLARPTRTSGGAGDDEASPSRGTS